MLHVQVKWCFKDASRKGRKVHKQTTCQIVPLWLFIMVSDWITIVSREICSNIMFMLISVSINSTINNFPKKSITVKTNWVSDVPKVKHCVWKLYNTKVVYHWSTPSHLLFFIIYLKKLIFANIFFKDSIFNKKILFTIFLFVLKLHQVREVSVRVSARHSQKCTNIK